MKRLTVLAITLAVIIVVGGAVFVWLLLADDEVTQESMSQTEVVAQQQEIDVREASIKDLLARGEDMTCSFSYEDEEGRTTGQSYFSDERVRGSFTLNTEAQQSTSEMLVADGGAYIWSLEEMEGIKTTGLDFDESNESSSESTAGPVDADQKYNVECTSWTVDETVFDVPSDVEFTDFTQLFDGILESSNDGEN